MLTLSYFDKVLRRGMITIAVIIAIGVAAILILSAYRSGEDARPCTCTAPRR